jgi:hypothetical protein
VISSQNPAKTGKAVTYTATVTGTGKPTGTVSFMDGGTPIVCTGGTQTLDNSGLATCQVTYSAIGKHPITVAYPGDSRNAESISPSTGLTQRVVNANVTGLAFASVKVGTASVPYTCSGVIGTTYTCTIDDPKPANNATVSATVSFVSAGGSPTSYSSELSTVDALQTGKTPGSSSVTIAANETATSATVSAQKNGSNPAQVTVTFTDGGTTWTAVLKIN